MNFEKGTASEQGIKINGEPLTKIIDEFSNIDTIARERSLGILEDWLATAKTEKELRQMFQEVYDEFYEKIHDDGATSQFADCLELLLTRKILKNIERAEQGK